MEPTIICGWCGAVEDESGCPNCEDEIYGNPKDFN